MSTSSFMRVIGFEAANECLPLLINDLLVSEEDRALRSYTY